MRKNTFNFAMAAVMLLVLGSSMILQSCKNNKKNQGSDEPVTPVVTVVDSIPTSILPAEIYSEVASWINLYKGNTPTKRNGQYVSKPHALIHESFNPGYDPEDSTIFYSDRYLAFIYTGDNLDFYGKQWSDSIPDGQGGYHPGFYEEHRSYVQITGDGDDFCCFYYIEGYPHGIYLKQSTIFSGTITDDGLENFRVAVVMAENDGDPSYQDKNSYRILGDYDEMAEKYNWMDKGTLEKTGSVADPFFLFRK